MKEDFCLWVLWGTQIEAGSVHMGFFSKSTKIAFGARRANICSFLFHNWENAHVFPILYWIRLVRWISRIQRESIRHYWKLFKVMQQWCYDKDGSQSWPQKFHVSRPLPSTQPLGSAIGLNLVYYNTLFRFPCQNPKINSVLQFGRGCARYDR